MAEAITGGVTEGGAAYDCVVIGAGPAGSVTARELACRGASVLLVDRATFPREKVCGCCVNPRALAELDRAGLGSLATRLGAVPLTSFEVSAGGRRALIRHPLGVAVSRGAFDQALISAATEAGAHFRPGSAAELLPDDNAGFRTVRLKGEDHSRTVRGRFVVSATGLVDLLPGRTGSRPVTGSKIGAGAIAATAPPGYSPHRVYMACGRDGYVGLVCLEDGRLDLAAALGPDSVRRHGGIGPAVEGVLSASGFPAVPGVRGLGWKGTPLLTRYPTGRSEGRVFRVGDAAGYVEPFTGEGIAWAVAGGLRLAALLAVALTRGDEPPPGAWAAAHRNEVGRRQLTCRAASATLRSPWLTRSLIGILNAAPGAARRVLMVMHGTAP